MSFEIVAVFFAGLVIGGLIAFFALRSSSSAANARVEELRGQLAAASQGFDGLRDKLTRSESAKIEAETRLIESDKRNAEQLALLDDAQRKLETAFKSLAADALARNNQGFLDLAEEKFKALKQTANQDLESRHEAIANLVNPLSEAAREYQKQAKELEEKRLQNMGQVSEQLASLAKAAGDLQGETSKLANALRSPQVRGRWGEIALRKTAELAGMSRHCDFVEQESVDTEEGRLRPDMIVKLPAGREVVVDSKVSLAAYMEALEAKTDTERELALVRHTAQITQHVNRLAAKDYWDQFPAAPEFVVLFIPNDSLLAAAAERDPNLIESALSKKIIIATPTTFIALLRAIAFGWRQEQLAENAQRISVLGQEIAERIATVVEHMNKVGAGLRQAFKSFNDATASIESRLLVSARKFKDLGVAGKKDIGSIEPIDTSPRSLSLPIESEEENPTPRPIEIRPARGPSAKV